MFHLHELPPKDKDQGEDVDNKQSLGPDLPILSRPIRSRNRSSLRWRWTKVPSSHQTDLRGMSHYLGSIHVAGGRTGIMIMRIMLVWHRSVLACTTIRGMVLMLMLVKLVLVLVLVLVTMRQIYHGTGVFVMVIVIVGRVRVGRMR
jgi:hypothetical protein